MEPSLCSSIGNGLEPLWADLVGVGLGGISSSSLGVNGAAGTLTVVDSVGGSSAGWCGGCAADEVRDCNIDVVCAA